MLAAYGFTALDWGVVIFYLAVTTLLGARLAGKQSTIRDFFLGGRKLPWYAVAGSIVATEISAVTFVSVPAVVFAEGGNLTYLQLGLVGGLIARWIVAYVLVPAYYAREIYSPYDYMGARLGAGVKRVTSGLFTLGGVLGQSARVYLTALVLTEVLGAGFFEPLAARDVPPLVQAVALVGIVAVAWTLLGGITTVIWTDALLFLVFVVGALVALCTVAAALGGGFAELFAVAREGGKLRLVDANPSLAAPYTLLGALASVAGMTGIYGTDQMMAQRIFCCRGPREARKAVLASWFGIGVTVLVGLVGAGLYAYYRAHPPAPERAAELAADPDRVFPRFIVEVIRPGLTGLIIAGIFAAAISSLDSILAALSQTTISAVWQPWRRRRLGLSPEASFPPDEEARQVRAGRWFVVCFGVLLCAAASAMELVKQAGFDKLLDLAQSMAAYTSGALLACFVLAFSGSGLRAGRGFWFAAPLSVLAVYGLMWHGTVPLRACLAGSAVLLAVYAWLALRGSFGFAWRGFLALATGCALVVALERFAFTVVDGRVVTASWTWQGLLGFLVAFLFSYAVAPGARAAEDETR